MAMPVEVKTRLREAAKRKRERTVLLKDILPGVLPIFAVDHFDDKGIADDNQWGYISRASKEQVAELAKFLPHEEVAMSFRFGTHKVTMFPYARISHALTLLVTNPEKYLRLMPLNWKPSKFR